MELSINSKKKASLQKAIARNKKSVRIILAIAKTLMFIGIVGGGLYVLINVVLIPAMNIQTVLGDMQKDISWIIISTSFIVSPCLIFSVCLKALAGNLAGSDNSARVDESLLISNEAICYAFRLKYQSLASERRVLTIQFSQIKAINFDSKTEGIEFIGNFTSEYFDDYRNQQPVDTASIDRFIIYDYFSPSLKEALRSNGVAVIDAAHG